MPKFLTNLVTNYAKNATSDLTDKAVSAVSEQVSDLAQNPYVKTASIAIAVSACVFGFYFLIRLINELFTLKRNL